MKALRLVLLKKALKLLVVSLALKLEEGRETKYIYKECSFL